MRKLIFSHAGNFQARYGAAELNNLKTRLRSLQQSDANRGLTTAVVFVDDAASLSPFGVPALAVARPSAVQVKDVIEAVATGQPQDFFLIVGGDDIIPFFVYSNPVGGDDDRSVHSDNGYAVAGMVPEDEHFIIRRALGRLPTGTDPDPSVLWNQLDEIINFRPAAPSQGSGVGFSAAEWDQVSQQVLSQLNIPGNAYHPSPPVDLDAKPPQFDPNWLAGRTIQYFNLHGALRTADWYGQSGTFYPRACEPAIVPAGVKDGVVGSEACYGGDIVGTSMFPRKVSTAMSLACMKEQVIGFCGSTTIAYGGTNSAPQLCGADVLISYFLGALQSGKELGSALLFAKSQLAADVLHTNGALEPITEKTLLQFVLYGDPSVVVCKSGAAAAKAPGSLHAMVSLAQTGELLEYFSDLGARRVVVSRADPKTVRPSALPLPEFAAKREPRLVHQETRRLDWEPAQRRRAAESLSAKLMTEMSEVVPVAKTNLWTTETYALGETEEGSTQYFVRVIQQEPLRLLRQGVSR